MPNISEGDGGAASFSSEHNGEEETFEQFGSTDPHQLEPSISKKRRKLPGNPDPSAEVIALSPKTLMATNRFVCEICNKGFQRDQNLQLHRRGHNLPWKLKQRMSSEMTKKRVYVCPEPSCIHHNPARALGDLTGIKKHYSRKHGEKKWKCDKCSKKYAVQSDWKAHAKVCGTKEYTCDCGTIFSRRDSFVTHRAFCDALAEENTKVLNTHGLQASELNPSSPTTLPETIQSDMKTPPLDFLPAPPPKPLNMAPSMFSGCSPTTLFSTPKILPASSSSSLHFNAIPPNMSATALLQKAAQIGATTSTNNIVCSPMLQRGFGSPMEPSLINDGVQVQTDKSQLAGVISGFYYHQNQNLSSGLDLQKLAGNNKEMRRDENLTVDFLGVGGRNFHELQHQEMGLENQAVSQQRMQGLSAVWDV
nr:protein indeterminate-domain 2-like [Ipomoea batatas]